MTLKDRLAVKLVKVRLFEAFNNIRSKLQIFIIQLDMYLKMNREKLAYKVNKIFFVLIYFTDLAFNQFKPFIKDYQK